MAAVTGSVQQSMEEIRVFRRDVVQAVLRAIPGNPAVIGAGSAESGDPERIAPAHIAAWAFPTA